MSAMGWRLKLTFTVCVIDPMVQAIRIQTPALGPNLDLPHGTPSSRRWRPQSSKGRLESGDTHLMRRFAGEHERHLDIAAKIKRDLGW